jgi:hypothetical protein
VLWQDLRRSAHLSPRLFFSSKCIARVFSIGAMRSPATHRSGRSFAQGRANRGNAGKAIIQRSAPSRQRHRKLSLNNGRLPMKPYLLTLLIAVIAMLSDFLGQAERAQRKQSRARVSAGAPRNIARLTQRRAP